MERWEGTLEEARKVVGQKGAKTFHLIHYHDEIYGFMSHITCEWCDYCSDELLLGAEIHENLEDPYAKQRDQCE